MVNNGELQGHPCGIHPHNIPIDALTGLAAIPYKDAEALGYYKLDFLHLSAYDIFDSRQEIEYLLELEPHWELLQVPSVVEGLFQLGKHADLLSKIKPTSLEDLADALALIRPGKQHLLDLYLKHKDVGRRALWTKGENGYTFKKSHAISYAMVIKLQLLIAGGNK